MKKLLLSLVLLPFMASAQNYVKTDITDLSTGDVVVIVDQTSSYALANDGGTSTKGKVIGITLTDDKNEISFASDEVAKTGEFTIEVNSGNYKFNADGSYLYVTSSNDGVCVGTGTNNTFTWTDGYLKSTSGRYLGVYVDKPNWRCYTSINANIKETVTAIYKKEVAPASVKTPVFSVAAGIIDAGTEVAISCETEGANIYYTLDGTEPTSASTAYSAPIAITESCTLKAIAELNGEYSYIASTAYTVVPTFATLDGVVKLENGVTFKYTGELSVTYVNGPYVYVYDPVSKVQSLIYKANLGLDKGQVIKGGWAGKVSIHQGLFEIAPDATLEVVEGATATLPEAIKVTAESVDTYIANDYINNYMVLSGVELTDAINAKKSYTVTIGDKDVTVYNTFELVAEAGKYNIEGFLSNHTSGLQFVPIAFNELKPWALSTKYECPYAILDLTILTGEATIAEGEDVITLTLEGEETPLTSTRNLFVVRESDSHSPIVGYALNAEIDKSGFYILHVPAGFFVNADGVGNAEYTETLELEGNVVWVTFPENGLRLITDSMETIGVIEQTEETVFSSDMQIGNDGEETYFFLAQNCELEDIDTQVYGSINPMDDVEDADVITAPLNDFANTNFPFMVKGGYYNVTVQWNSPNPVIIFTKTEKKADEMVMPEKLYLMGWYANELTLEGKVFSAKNVSITSVKEKLYFNATGDEGDYEYGLADVNTTIAVGEAYTLVSKGEPFTIAAGKYDVTVDWNGSAPIVTFTEPVTPANTMNIYWDNSDTNWIGTPIFIYANETAYEEIMPNKDLTPEGYYEYTIPTDAAMVYFFDPEDEDNMFFLVERGDDGMPTFGEFVPPVANGIYSEAGFLGIYDNAPADYVTIYFDNTEAQWAQPYVMFSVDGTTPYEIDMVPVVERQAGAITTYAVAASQLYRAELPANTTFFQFMDRETGEDSYAHETPVNNTIYGLTDKTMEYNDDNVTAIIGINADANAAARYFNLQGIEVKAPAAGQVYIMIQNGKSTKVVK